MKQQRLYLYLVAISMQMTFALSAFSMSAWDHENDPSIIDGEDTQYQFEYNLAKLPLAGQLTVKPWTDSYWPTVRGGI
ncbi:MAG: hypothetical protein HQK53_18800, partial [Oligoflexia bacterium]|nr:hypothetical protein [Oligoflexia bacterium]